MKNLILTLSSVLFLSSLFAQERKLTFHKSITTPFQKKYITTHEVVKGEDRKLIQFYKEDKSYKVTCAFIKSKDTSIISMPTSGTAIVKKDFKKYGKINFLLKGIKYELTIYQSYPLFEGAYKNYLFLPFGDNTSGVDTYGSGRYIDLLTTAIKNNKVTIDFNEAYNPYCAYASGFNCPIPPIENLLKTDIKAGEMNYLKVVKH